VREIKRNRPQGDEVEGRGWSYQGGASLSREGEVWVTPDNHPWNKGFEKGKKN